MKIRWVSEPCAARSLCPQRSFSSLGYQSPFFFRQGSVQVQHERVRVPAEFGHDERHPLSHQARNKGNVSGKPIQLGDDYAAFRTLAARAAASWGRLSSASAPLPLSNSTN